jgi:hypothetical protein
MTQLQSFITIWHAAPAKTWEDLKSRELIFGATGKGSEPYVVPQMMNDILGTKIKLVAGYPGIQDVNLAMEKGEVHGRGGGWTATMKPEFFAPEMKVRFLVQIGDAKLDRIWDGGPGLSDVPLLIDLASRQEDKQLLGLLNRVLSRPLAVAPEVPGDRVAALRKAYDEVMKDKETRISSPRCSG